MSWSAIKSHVLSTSRRQLFAKRTILYLLLFPGCPPIFAAIRLPHRHHKNHRVHFQLQEPSEVTNKHRVTCAKQKQNPFFHQIKVIEFRTTVCETFLNGKDRNCEACLRTNFASATFLGRGNTHNNCTMCVEGDSRSWMTFCTERRPAFRGRCPRGCVLVEYIFIQNRFIQTTLSCNF